MLRPALLFACLAAAAPAQIDKAPSFDERPAFKNSADGPIDSSSHVSARGEATASNLAAQVDRFVPPADPPEPRQAFNKANAMLKAGHLAAAASAFDEAARQYPRSDSLLAGAAITRLLTGRDEAGADAILDLARRTPKDTRLIALLGESAASVPARKPSYESALRAFAAAFPANGESRFYLAQLLAAGLPEAPGEAVALWKLAATLDKRDPRPCLELARSATQRPEEAIVWLEKALARNNALPDAHYRLSRLYSERGDVRRAAFHLEQYRQLRKK